MSAIVTQAAQKINADTAGHTQTEPAQTTAAPPSPSELLGGDSFSGLWQGGWHPEALLTAVDTALVKPTESLLGPNGGLIPRRTTGSAPGPAGETAAVAEKVSSAVSSNVSSFAARVKGLFGARQPSA